MLENELKYLDSIEMGRRIRAQREFVGMTREDLAGNLSVSSKFIADIEYGEKGISIKKLYLLSQILGISTDYILAGKTQDGTDDQVHENIIAGIVEPLKKCNAQQLRCMENITKYYVEALKEK